ncbi:hypothetical protein SAMD00019534_006830, partial [Acytostelium subglobosum LB1]|uniref:hypothetical protein n=1 Tax=Acytostelium subglobosum LB1 TaxID=1410327 RepID=UPI00064514BB
FIQSQQTMRTKITPVHVDDQRVIDAATPVRPIIKKKSKNGVIDPYYSDRSVMHPKKGGKDVYSREEYLQDYSLGPTEYIGPQQRMSSAVGPNYDGNLRRSLAGKINPAVEKALWSNVPGGVLMDAPLLGPDGLPLTAASVNAPFNIQLKRHYNSLTRLMDTQIFRERADNRTRKILFDLRNVLGDAIVMVETRGTDKQFINLFEDAMMFKGDLSSDNDLKTMLMTWQSTFSKLATGRGSKSIRSDTKELFTGLRRSDSILSLMSEGTKFLHMIILDRHNPGIDAQRELVFDLFFKTFGALASNPAYRHLVSHTRTFATDLVETERYEFSNVAAPKLEAYSKNTNLLSMNSNLKSLVRSLISDPNGSASVDRFFTHGNVTIEDMRKNPVYEKYFSDLRGLLAEVSANPSLFEDPSYRNVVREMYNRGEKIIVESRNTPSLQNFIKEGDVLRGAIQNDPLNRSFYNNLKEFSNNFQTAPGKMPVDLQLLEQIKLFTVPFLLEEFRTITVPGQSGATPDGKIAYKIGAINLCSVELLPENIHMEVSHKFNTDPYTLNVIDPDTVIWVELTSINARIDKMPWAFQKFGFPSIKDGGLADIRLDKRGARVGATVRVLGEGYQKFVQVLDSYCYIDSLSIKLYNCKHSILYKMFNLFARNAVKKAIEKAVAENLAEIMTKYDYKAYAKYTEAKRKAGVRMAKLQAQRANAKKIIVVNKGTTSATSSIFRTIAGKTRVPVPVARVTKIAAPTTIVTEKVVVTAPVVEAPPASTSSATYVPVESIDMLSTNAPIVRQTAVPLFTTVQTSDSSRQMANEVVQTVSMPTPTPIHAVKLVDSQEKKFMENARMSLGPSMLGTGS